MSRYGVTEEDIEREAEQDDRNYEAARKGCLYGEVGCFSLVTWVGSVFMLPAWLLFG